MLAGMQELARMSPVIAGSPGDMDFYSVSEGSDNDLDLELSYAGSEEHDVANGEGGLAGDGLPWQLMFGEDDDDDDDDDEPQQHQAPQGTATEPTSAADVAGGAAPALSGKGHAEQGPEGTAALPAADGDMLMLSDIKSLHDHLPSQLVYHPHVLLLQISHPDLAVSSTAPAAHGDNGQKLETDVSSGLPMYGFDWSTGCQRGSDAAANKQESPITGARCGVLGAVKWSGAALQQEQQGQMAFPSAYISCYHLNILASVSEWYLVAAAVEACTQQFRVRGEQDDACTTQEAEGTARRAQNARAAAAAAAAVAMGPPGAAPCRKEASMPSPMPEVQLPVELASIALHDVWVSAFVATTSSSRDTGSPPDMTFMHQVGAQVSEQDQGQLAQSPPWFQLTCPCLVLRTSAVLRAACENGHLTEVSLDLPATTASVGQVHVEWMPPDEGTDAPAAANGSWYTQPQALPLLHVGGLRLVGIPTYTLCTAASPGPESTHLSVVVSASDVSAYASKRALAAAAVFAAALELAEEEAQARSADMAAEDGNDADGVSEDFRYFSPFSGYDPISHGVGYPEQAEGTLMKPMLPGFGGLRGASEHGSRHGMAQGSRSQTLPITSIHPESAATAQPSVPQLSACLGVEVRKLAVLIATEHHHASVPLLEAVAESLQISAVITPRSIGLGPQAAQAGMAGSGYPSSSATGASTAAPGDMDVVVQVNASLELDTFNLDRMGWEPVLDPWQIKVRIRDSK